MIVKCSYDELVEVSALKPNPMNPNQHPEEQIELLALIIQETGWRDPVTVSKRSGYIVRGHGRLMAAKKLRLDKVPVDFQDYETEHDEMADMIADNAIQELSELDLSMVRNLMESIEDKSKWIITAFDWDEIERIFSDQEQFLDKFSEEPGSDEVDSPGGKSGKAGDSQADPVVRFQKLGLMFSLEDRNFIMDTVSKYQQRKGINMSSDAFLRMLVEWEAESK